MRHVDHGHGIFVHDAPATPLDLVDVYAAMMAYDQSASRDFAALYEIDMQEGLTQTGACLGKEDR
jgi:hypothetical protein